ncbi:MAG TPA: type II toxin-antitoxin system VapB family antitoxin [Propylenella sp.]|nr:type II toxin-antitoxin system VapB family antitoxin [Propylenella sp.]
MTSTSQLNIKNPEARQLAIKISQVTGESVTEAVTVALRERLDRVTKVRSREGLAARLKEIGRRAAALPVLDPRDPDDMLYDEDGLPK